MPLALSASLTYHGLAFPIAAGTFGPMSDPWILGYSCTHNGAVCLLKGREIVAAVQEERLTGVKRARLKQLDESLAFRYCLDAAGISADDLDAIVGAYFSGDRQSGTSVIRQGWAGRYMTIPHHLAHAFGAFAMSGFEHAAVLVIDGQGGLGEFLPADELVNVKRVEAPKISRPAEVISIYEAQRGGIRCVEKHLGEWMPNLARLRPDHPMQTFASLGGMYSSVSHQIFGDAMDAGKVMGLAAYGRHSIPSSDFFSIADDGHFVFRDTVPARYANTRHWPDDRERNQDLATSVQHALEDGIHYLVQHSRELTGLSNLCYAGGVALNAVANEQIIRREYFDDVYIMAAAEDSGTAIGAAYYGLAQLGHQIQRDRNESDSVGRIYSSANVSQAVAKTPYIEVIDVDDPIAAVAELLDEGNIVGWFSGGSEIGPRALGQRSILSDARSPDAKTRLNAKVKHREAFRPFAPLVLEEQVCDWFEAPPNAPDSPLMLRTFQFHSEAAARVPAVVHEDGSGRLQTLTADTNPDLHRLLREYFSRTGVPIIVNTSFNVMGEPIVETPEDALWCLLYTDIDYCYLEDRLVRRSDRFTSMLDLHPHLSASRFSIEGPIKHRQLQFNVDSGTTVVLIVETPWGVCKPVVPHIVLPILQLADGTRSGREILKIVRRSTQLDEPTFRGILRHLRRAHILRFTK